MSLAAVGAFPACAFPACAFPACAFAGAGKGGPVPLPDVFGGEHISVDASGDAFGGDHVSADADWGPSLGG